MDDDYELFSKRSIVELKEENKRLKLEATTKPTKIEFNDNEIVSKITAALNEEGKIERDLITKSLNELKELNKSTLDNLITKTQELDDRLEGMIGSMAGLVETLKDIVDHSNENNNPQLELDLKEIKASIDVINSRSELEGTGNINMKLEEIDSFMKNLRVLLSYVKPNDLKIEKPTNKEIKPNSL